MRTIKIELDMKREAANHPPLFRFKLPDAVFAFNKALFLQADP
jgi:hypothetical protein